MLKFEIRFRKEGAKILKSRGNLAAALTLVAWA
jgi:hypothetical protein